MTTNRLQHHALWLLAWFSLALPSCWLLTRVELGNLQDAFDTDARIVHRLLSQRAVQHDAILETLALLRNADTADNPEQRLASVYPQILSVQRSDAQSPWDDPALQAAENLSQREHHAVLADVDLAKGHYRLVLAGTHSSFALRIDIRAMVPWNDWPMDAANSAVQVAMGLDTQEILLQPGTFMAGISTGWNFAAQKTLAAQSQPFVVESRRHIAWSAAPWGKMAGAALAWALLLAVGHTIVRLRQERLRTQERFRMGQLTRLNTLGELAAGMAHELNQPLTAVLANAQAASRMLEDDPVAISEVRHALQHTAQQARRAADVVGRLRRMVERPGVANEAQTVNPMELTRKALYLLEPEILQCQVAPQLHWIGEPFSIWGDAVALEQILHNLLTNALHALEQVPAPRRSLRVLFERSHDVGLITVQDSGPGIPTHVLPHVFEPFFTTREGGLGLGLSLCETLAASMGGTLTASATVQGGASFSVSLPVAPVQGTAP